VWLDLEGLGGPVEDWGDGRVDGTFAPSAETPDSESGSRTWSVEELWVSVGVSTVISTWHAGAGGAWRVAE
jgi:hypothetical protein